MVVFSQNICCSKAKIFAAAIFATIHLPLAAASGKCAMYTMYVSAHRFVKMHFPKGDTDTYLLLYILLSTDAFSAFLTTIFVKMISSRKSSAKLHKFSRLSCNENEE